MLIHDNYPIYHHCMCEQIDSFRGVEYSKSVAKFYTPENLEPEADWHPRIPGIVYWGKYPIVV